MTLSGSAGGAVPRQKAGRVHGRRPSPERERSTGITLALPRRPNEGSARQPSIVGRGGRVQGGQWEPARQDAIRGGGYPVAAAFDQRADRALVQTHRTRAP